MTRNLFQDKSSNLELEEILKRHPRKPLLPTIGSEPWERARRNPGIARLAGSMRPLAIEEATLPLPLLTDELYADFKKTGIRLTFENVYFERRRRLARAVISLLLSRQDDPDHDLLLASALEKYISIFEEISWALPAHVNWKNSDLSGKDPMQIDLFCAETANLMAEVLDLLGPLVPAALRSQVQARLQTQIFENYLNRFDEFHWTQCTHNWNAVCHQGTIGAALSQLDDPAMLAQMLVHAREGLPFFLSGFTKDGGCSEGIGYWSYGFGWFIILNEQLETRTGGELSLVEGDEQIRRIAQFGPRMSLTGGKLVNFADNGAEGGISPSLLAYLGNRLNEPDCRHKSDEYYRKLIQSEIDLQSERCDLFKFGRLFLGCPEKPVEEIQPASDCFLPNLAVMVAHGTDARGHVWDFAAKAGHNAEHHNHNDCGNFLLNIDGERLIAEIGSPEYVHDFFSEKRYEFLAARTRGHCLPVINDCEQVAGEAYASKVVEHRLTPEKVELTVDATACYPAEAGCQKFVRHFAFDKKAGKLTVVDSFELSRTDKLEGALISIHPIVINKGRASAVVRKGPLELVIHALPGTRFNWIEVLPYQDHGGHPAIIYRLVLIPERLSGQVSLGVEIELAPSE